MRVKIGDKWYSDKDIPICVELTDSDKKNINNMHSNANKYASFPDDAGMKADEAIEWMQK